VTFCCWFLLKCWLILLPSLFFCWCIPFGGIRAVSPKEGFLPCYWFVQLGCWGLFNIWTVCGYVFLTTWTYCGSVVWTCWVTGLTILIFGWLCTRLPLVTNLKLILTLETGTEPVEERPHSSMLHQQFLSVDGFLFKPCCCMKVFEHNLLQLCWVFSLLSKLGKNMP